MDLLWRFGQLSRVDVRLARRKDTTPAGDLLTNRGGDFNRFFCHDSSHIRAGGAGGHVGHAAPPPMMAGLVTRLTKDLTPELLVISVHLRAPINSTLTADFGP